MKNTQKRNVGWLGTHVCIQSEGQNLRLIFMGAYILVDHSSTKRDKNFVCIVLVELMQKLNINRFDIVFTCTLKSSLSFH